MINKNELVELNAETEVEWFKSMMESCYAYGKLSKNNRYIIEFRKELGEDAWHKTFDEYSKYLKHNFTVEYAGTDNEGVKYNTLIPKLKDDK